MKDPKKNRLEILTESQLKPDEWGKLIRQYMERALHLHKRQCNKVTNGKVDVAARFDYDTAMVKRRSQALLNMRDTIIQRYGHSYAEWILFNVETESYAAMDESIRVLYAAAIWILDQITESGEDYHNYFELFEVLPRDSDLLNEMKRQDIWDSQYEEPLIASVEYVLRYRNRDIAPLEDDGYDGTRALTSKLAAERKDHADAPSRVAFEKLLALIPQEKIDHAVQSFTECLWVWIDNFFTAEQYLDKGVAESRSKLNEIRKQINEKRTQIEKLIEQAKRERRKKAPKAAPPKAPLSGISPIMMNPEKQDKPYSVLSSFPKPDLQRFEEQTPFQLMQAFDEIHDLDDLEQELADEYQMQIARKAAFVFNLNHKMSEAEKQEMLDEHIPELQSPLPQFDCYEMCFALLYLIEQDSDLAWLYGACFSFMSEVGRKLPWGYDDYSEVYDEYWIPEHIPLAQKPVEYPDWYDNKYAIKGQEDRKKNIAQIVYETTGCIMPRDMHRYDSMAKELNRYGFRGGNVTAMLYCILALGYSRRRIEALNFEEWYMNLSLEEPESEEETELTQEDLLLRISALEKENRQLRSALHSTEKSVKDAKQQFTSLKEKTEMEHRELAELREIIFRQTADETGEEKVNEGIFPYEVQKDIIVFGGHDTWLKTFRQLLSGKIKYVGREQNFDASMIRYADTVWIQPNAISHAQYYKIMDAVRKYNKPIHYFQFASAAKCAEQIYLDEN